MSTILTTLFCTLVFFIFLIFLITTSINMNKWGGYKKTYEALNNGQYTFNFENSGCTFFKKNNSTEDIIFFENGSIKLIDDYGYIHNAFHSRCDLYTNYYYNKLNKWLLENKYRFQFKETNKIEKKIYEKRTILKKQKSPLIKKII